ncbi:MAG: NAD(P)-dependent alcohol dehydrogenase [Actinomycetota bacterium]
MTTTTAVSAASIAGASTHEAPTGPSAPRMRAITQTRYGDSSVLEMGEIAVPTIAPDEVLIEVGAAAIDRGTEHLMTGTPWLIRLAGFGLRRPKQRVLGLDVAGVVREVGADVTRFRVGDEVFGIASGSLAEFAVAKEVKLARKPENLTFEEAAASTLSGITALQALTDVGRLSAGERVLVIGASGGVGTFTVQLARVLGATVDGVAGTPNVGLVESLGADTVYDHRVTDLDSIDQRYDLIVDIGGRNRVRRIRRLLTSDGTLVFVGGEGGNRVTGGIGRQVRAAALSPFVSHRLNMFVSTEHHTFIDRLAVHLRTGQVAPHIGGRFPLEQGIDAVRRLEAGMAQGKTVIQVSISLSGRDLGDR